MEFLDGGSDPQNLTIAGSEANLDTQYTIGIATNVPTTFISAGTLDSDFLTSLTDTATFLLGQATVPHAMTTSYSDNENLFSESLAK